MLTIGQIKMMEKGIMEPGRQRDRANVRNSESIRSELVYTLRNTGEISK